MLSNGNAVITGGHFTSVVNNHESRQGRGQGQGFERLWKQVATGALHNSGEVSDQPKCHPGTRVIILEHLEAWAKTLTYAHRIKWLHGPAGSGKSSILWTIAQSLFDQGLLLASFFFFRSAPSRNSSGHFITTIAYQLAVNIPATRPHIEEAVERNPLIFSLSLWDQAEALIASPIRSLLRENPSFDGLPRIIVVDGLDECQDPKKQCELLEVLCRIIKDLPIAVLVASRPEHHIRDAFDRGDLNMLSSPLPLDDSYNPDADIKKYLQEHFDDIQRKHPPPVLKSPWPSPGVVDKLVAKASGQFIYASTVVRFISSPRHNPAKRLAIILGSIDAGDLKPFEQLDILYSTIFLNISEDVIADVKRILGVLLDPFHDLDDIPLHTPAFLERLFTLDAGSIRHLLFDLESLLTISGHDKPVRFFHASLGDYLFKQSRSHEFFIDGGNVFADLAHQCIVRLSDSKDWREFKEFFFSNGLYIFSKATPTAELQNAIEGCDPAKFVNFSNYNLDPLSKEVYTLHIVPTLLKAICKSKFPDATDIYHKKLASYAQVIRPQIQFYFQEPGPKRLLIAAASSEVTGEASFYKALLHIFQVSDEMWDEQKRRGLHLGSASRPLIQVIQDILDDDSDAEDFINANQYADVALYLLEFMTQESRGSLPHESVSVERCVSIILPPLLLKAPTRQDLLGCIQNRSVPPRYREFSSIGTAWEAYSSRRPEPALKDEIDCAPGSLHPSKSKKPWYKRWILFRRL